MSVSSLLFTELYDNKLCIGSGSHLRCCNIHPCCFWVGPANDCDPFHFCGALQEQLEPFMVWSAGLRSPRPAAVNIFIVGTINKM